MKGKLPAAPPLPDEIAFSEGKWYQVVKLMNFLFLRYIWRLLRSKFVFARENETKTSVFIHTTNLENFQSEAGKWQGRGKVSSTFTMHNKPRTKAFQSSESLPKTNPLCRSRSRGSRPKFLPAKSLLNLR